MMMQMSLPCMIHLTRRESLEMVTQSYIYTNLVGDDLKRSFVGKCRYSVSRSINDAFGYYAYLGTFAPPMIGPEHEQIHPVHQA